VQFCARKDGTKPALVEGVNASAHRIDLPVHGLPAVAVAAKPDQARRRGTARWPVALCALVALVSATAAFTEGPLARRPQLAPYASAVRGRAIELGHRVHALLPR
jgi:hypothetical protein